MKTTVKYSKENYREVVLEDGRKQIICDLVAEIKLFNIRNFEWLANDEMVYAFLKGKINKNGNYVMHTRGIATCAPSDEYNYETGRRIAFTRAQREAFNNAGNIITEITRRFIDDLQNTAENCFMSADDCLFHSYVLMYGIEHAEEKLIADYCKKYNMSVDDFMHDE